MYLPGFELSPELRATADLGEAVGDADLLIVGVPTSGFRKVLGDAKPYLRPWIPVVSLSKGLEKGSLLRMTEVIKDLLPGHPAAALTGPNIAREILEGKAAAAVIATEDLDVAAEIQKVLTRGVFRVYVNHDVVGCEIGGALKNVVAIAVRNRGRSRCRRQHTCGGDRPGTSGAHSTRGRDGRGADDVRGARGRGGSRSPRA